MKKAIIFFLFIVLLISFLPASAQLKSPLDNAFQADVENVILDYPNSFQHYIGKEIDNNPQSTDYSSLLKIRGAEECTITKYPAKKRDRYSYLAVMLTTDDFEKAKSTFDSYYSRLKRVNIHFANESYNLNGEYEAPTEEKKFTSSLFSISANEETVKRLKVELSMEYQVVEWKVKLLVYEKEREDDEQGETKDN
ncbi:MAG: hypothetical protein QM764_06270 [Chitinophagaceae bacterium]